MTGVLTFDSPRGKRQIGRILDRLAQGKATRAQLMTDLCMGMTTVRSYLKHLQEQPNRRVRIVGYARTTGRKAPLYALGSMKDAPIPKADNRQQRRARERDVLKADADRADRHYARKRVNDKIRRAKQRAKPVTWFAALMGA